MGLLVVQMRCQKTQWAFSCEGEWKKNKNQMKIMKRDDVDSKRKIIIKEGKRWREWRRRIKEGKENAKIFRELHNKACKCLCTLKGTDYGHDVKVHACLLWNFHSVLLFWWTGRGISESRVFSGLFSFPDLIPFSFSITCSRFASIDGQWESRRNWGRNQKLSKLQKSFVLVWRRIHFWIFHHL